MYLFNILFVTLLLVVHAVGGPCDSFPYVRRVDVATLTDLNSALSDAQPGDLIVLADGTYTGQPQVGVNGPAPAGTATNPITLCGSPNATITTGNYNSGIALRLYNTVYWVLYGFTLSGSKQGMVFQNVSYSVIDSLTVTNIANQCLYIKVNSTYNILRNSAINYCGSTGNGNGKGVYIGTSGTPTYDYSNYNSIINNVWGPYNTAESIDTREGTTGTLIEGNVFNGTGLSGASSANQVFAMRGNYGIARNNTVYHSLLYGVRTTVTTGWGNWNIFDGNYLSVWNPNTTVCAIYIHDYSSAAGDGNVVLCNNYAVAPTPLTNSACVDSLPAWALTTSTTGSTTTSSATTGATDSESGVEPTIAPTTTPGPTLPPLYVPDPPDPAHLNYKPCDSFNYLRRVSVSTSDELTDALANVTAGDLILLAPGNYTGQFLADGVSGTPEHWIILCGSYESILTVDDISNGNGAIEVHNAEYWYLAGFTIANSKKAIQFETVSYSVIDGLYIHDIGEEAIHVKINSSYNIIQNNWVSYTGLNPGRAGYGEGVYVGTANNNGLNDFSDYNTVQHNYLGPWVTAEGADIKEFTTGTYVYNNTFNGIGLSGQNSALTLLAVKGNYGLMQNNSIYHTIQHGTRTSVAYPGWGNWNVYDGNQVYVPEATGDGIYIHMYTSAAGSGNVILCNNYVAPPTPFSNNVPCKNNSDGINPIPSATIAAAATTAAAATATGQVSTGSSSTGQASTTSVVASTSAAASTGAAASTASVASSTGAAASTSGSATTGAPDTCTASISITQNYVSGWNDGVNSYSQWTVNVVATNPIYAINLLITPPAGSSVTSFWQITAQSDGTYTIQDWRLQSNQPIPAGTTVSFGYILSSSSAAAITVATASCVSPPKNCQVSAVQNFVSQWSDGQSYYQQYSFSFTNIGTSPTTSVDLTLLLPRGAYPSQYWNLATSDSTAQIQQTEQVHFTATLWGLYPGSSQNGAQGYVLTLNLTQAGSSAPLFEITGYQCQ